MISLADAQSSAAEPEHPEQDCTFWMRPDGQVCLQRFCPKQDVNYQPHTHSEYNIVICLAGAVTKTQMGETHIIEAGEAMMGNFGVEHASGYLTDENGCKAVCLTVDRRVLSGLLKNFRLPLPKGGMSPVFLGKLDNRVIYHCAKDVAQEMQNQKLGHQIILEGLASRILIETLRSWPRKAVESCEVDLTPRLPRRDFVRAYEFMRWCRKDAFRLQHLCRFLGSSEGRFIRLFRAATNTSPANFYNRLLLERGRDLLADRALSIKEISYQLGFKTSSHFVVAFHREFGIPPHAYRQGCDQESVNASELE